MSMPVPFTYTPNGGTNPIPCFPGAYYVNSGTGDNGMQFAVPIYGSAIYSNYNFGDLDDYYWVLPGFRLMTYNGTEAIIDAANTSNVIKRYTPGKLNNAEYGRLYYNTGSTSSPTWVEIRGVYENQPSALAV